MPYCAPEATTRFTYPGGMEGDWLHTEMV